MSIRSVSIRAKLIGAFTVLTLLLLALGAIGLNGTSTINGLLTDVNTNWLPSVRTAGELSTRTSRYTLSVFRHILTNDDAAIARVDEEIEMRRKTVDDAAKRYSMLVSSPEEKAVFETFEREWKTFVAEVEPVLILSRKNDN